ncbi:NAD-dependent epimerase/dehydratase family protein [Pseudothioglobus sp. nBUS_23]|uniref:NAD-dependent epimerase/dehydratase family protein n=1 Tax=Pseudothioglobus sp. nBUS_23 TaxID=3395318 RepID=UPI003EBB770E
MKIVITGGLGYIGTELCKLYSGEARFKEIIVIDNIFASERVSQLRNWGINFIHGDILDLPLIKEVLKDSDIVYHLAGITDVASTKTEAKEDKERLIEEVGITGTRNVINSMSKNAKLIFPSTHVVYEGLKETKFDIVETEPLLPVLSYSTGKAESEIDIQNSKVNYVILRLATVFGYSAADTMRINIMPNLFSKIASQNGTIRLFSGGKQHKSLVSVFDVVRSMKFMAEKNDISREVFHCSSDNTTVKKVAEICKEINSEVKLIETDDEIPNLGYTTSNKKILSTGFDFRYPLKESLKEMIKHWSKKNQFNTLELIQKGQKEFIDDRGKISNFELTEPINLIGYIESKAGTVRANHYHPIQEQKCLLISGQYISVLKDLSDSNSVIETNIINPGDIAVIHPHVAHTMVFLEDSVFLNLVRGEREHENYGVTHTIFYELVNESFRKQIVDYYKAECRVCGRKDLREVISLGLSPLANSLLKEKSQAETLYPLELNSCPNCFNCQLSFTVPANEMFDDYLYVSSTSKVFRDHFSEMAIKFIKDFKLDEKSFVVDIGSNDGVFLAPLKNAGVSVLGVDPAKNLADLANSKGLDTMHGYFNSQIADEIILLKGKADIVTAFNVFAHADDLKSIAKNVFKIMKKNGVFIIEVQYFADTIRDLTFDNIYHEHVNYWSVNSLQFFCNSLNLILVKIEHVETHGGSIRAFISQNDKLIDKSVEEFLTEEKKQDLHSFSTLKKFATRIGELKNSTITKINHLKSQGKTIVGYGSPAKATTVLNYYGIDNEIIDYIIEDNELKHNLFLPGMRIPIKSKSEALRNPPDFILVLAWNFLEDIKANNPELIQKGSKFITLKDLNW